MRSLLGKVIPVLAVAIAALAWSLPAGAFHAVDAHDVNVPALACGADAPSLDACSSSGPVPTGPSRAETDPAAESDSDTVGSEQPAPEALVAIVWLGIVGSGLAYICYFTILANWGATRTSMVAYLLPVVGILLGSVILDDPVTANRIAGTALVIAGIALVNSGPALRRLADRRTGVAQAESH